MNKSFTYYLIILLALASFFCACEQPIDWRENYSYNSTEPYGSKSVYELFDQLFEGEKVNVLDKDIKKLLPESLRDTISYLDYDELDYFDHEEIPPFNLSIVGGQISLAPSDFNSVYLALKDGAHVLIAANSFNDYLVNNLEITLSGIDADLLVQPDTALNTIPLVDVTISDQSFQPRQGILKKHITAYPSNFKPLLTDKWNHILAVKASIGKGELIICTSPKLFTNYHLLHCCPELVSAFYKDMPIQSIYWANQYYSYDTFEKSQKSLLDFIHQYPALMWAFYLAILGAFLYVISNMRRKQLIIKEITPNKNQSKLFVQSISQLYMRNNNHTEIAVKKIDLFYQLLYERFGVRRSHTEEQAAALILKRNITASAEDLKTQLSLINESYSSNLDSSAQLVSVFKAIEKIKADYL